MTSVMVGAYRGTSLISRLIRWRTWSDYSHVSLIRVTGEVIEAWHRGGVQARACWDEAHTPGTVIELYAVEASLEAQERAWAFAEAQVGRGYDWRGILGFLTRSDGQRPRLWFCSELVASAFDSAGVPLLGRMPPHRMSPGDVVHSPRLRYISSVVTR